MVDGGIGKSEQLKQARGKIALIKRGELMFSEKVANAEKAGVAAVVIYNNTNGPLIGNLTRTNNIPVMSMTKQDGVKLKERIEEQVSLIKTIIIEERDKLADFSSRGPVTSTWEIKPDVLAPGVAINSTIPGGYLSLQGTSMAAPHVAGASASIKQAHPNWGPQQIKAALMNYAKPLYNQEGEMYKTYEQGAGRIQLKDSIEAEVLIYPSSLKFGKFKLKDGIHEHQETITIENTSKEAQRITFHIPKQENGIHWDMPMSIELLADEKKEVAIVMTANSRDLKDKVNDGLITIECNGHGIHIPYLFVVEEPDYPRVMGFDFGKGDTKETYRYEVYLPGGAEEFGIALFDPDTMEFIQYLDWKRNVSNGLIQQDISVEDLPEEGIYVARVFARKAGQEDKIDVFVQINPL